MLIAIIALVIGAALYVVNMVGVNINANVICSLGVLIVGFAMLIKGADLFVEGASKIAAKFKIPQIVIGLTIVAMGTSAPEAAISISAAFQDAAAISIGNVVGSNIMNILLILGVAMFIAFFIMLAGLKTVRPNEALVLTLFGSYHGTVKEPGYYFVNPFCSAVSPAYDKAAAE